MRNLDFCEFKSCEMLGELFELSIERANFSSPIFIRRFMTSEVGFEYSDFGHLIGSKSNFQVIEEINELYKPSRKDPLYSPNEMHWIGFIYSALSFLYALTYKQVYRLFSATEIRNYYPICHTFSIEQATERMMENIEYKPVSDIEEGIRIVRKAYADTLLNSMLSSQVKVNLIYRHKLKSGLMLAKGAIKDTNLDLKEEVLAYVIDNSLDSDSYKGEVIGVVNRRNEDNILIVSNFKNLDVSSLRKMIETDLKKSRFKIKMR